MVGMMMIGMMSLVFGSSLKSQNYTVQMVLNSGGLDSNSTHFNTTISTSNLGYGYLNSTNYKEVWLGFPFKNLISPKDMTANLAVTFFIMMINLGIFMLPSYFRFSENIIFNHLIKHTIWIFGIYVLILNTTIMLTLAESAGLSISGELLVYFELLHYVAWAGLFWLSWNTLTSTIKLWKRKKQSEKEGIL